MYGSLKVLWEMLRSRGYADKQIEYLIPIEDIQNMFTGKFNECYIDSNIDNDPLLAHIYKIIHVYETDHKNTTVDDTTAGDGNSNTITIYFCKNNVCKHSFKYIVKTMVEQKITHAIIIYTKTITPAVRNMIGTLNLDIECFLANEFSFNPLQHRLVPFHEKINPDSTEYKEILKHKSKLPIITHKDIISRFLYFKKGDVIRIIRSEHHRRDSCCVSYRVCR